MVRTEQFNKAVRNLILLGATAGIVIAGREVGNENNGLNVKSSTIESTPIGSVTAAAVECTPVAYYVPENSLMKENLNSDATPVHPVANQGEVFVGTPTPNVSSC